MPDAIIHHPTTFNLGPLQLTGFGLAVLLAFVISQIIAQSELLRRGHEREAHAVSDLILACVIGTLIGGKIYYISVITHDVRDLFTRSGFVFWGGFMGSLVGVWLVVRAKKLSFVRYSDVAGICIAAGYAVGRTGCWAVGDDYGRPWSGPLAVAFPEGAPASTARNMEQLFGVPVADGVSPDTVLSVHPTQLYETALGFVMFVVLWRLRNHTHAEGWLFGVYCVLAGVERFLIEFLRAKDDRFFGGLTAAQVIALAIVAVGVIIMQRRSTVGPGRLPIYAPA
ncbi:MAG TPA: prolipoprotein diacylglyceryl transferase [Gemmatimonadaceae bacterium]|nr:prolipoprotein diacylglyceryl transferase [Gemmatimonadaceae bacterium]